MGLVKRVANYLGLSSAIQISARAAFWMGGVGLVGSFAVVHRHAEVAPVEPSVAEVSGTDQRPLETGRAPASFATPSRKVTSASAESSSDKERGDAAQVVSSSSTGSAEPLAPGTRLNQGHWGVAPPASRISSSAPHSRAEASSQSSANSGSGQASGVGGLPLTSQAADASAQASAASNTSSASSSWYSTIWPFTALTNSLYSYDTSLIDLTGGVARLTPNNQTDDDNSASKFGAPTVTMSGVQWDSTNNYVRLNTTTNNAELDASWAPQWSSLVGYWKFDGNWLDATTNGNNWTGPNAFNADAKIGTKSVYVDGNNRGYIANSTMMPTAKLTFAAWVKADTLSSGNRIIAGNLELSESFTLLVSGNGTSWRVGLQQSNSVGVAIQNTTRQIGTNRWTHVAVTADGSFVNLYMDGEFVERVAYDGTILPVTTCWNLGARGRVADCSSRDQVWDGKIDDAALWSVGLTAAEVRLLYSRQSAKYSGTLTSRVMDAYETGQSWQSLSWSSTLPFSKALPAAASSESQGDYASLYSGSLTSDLEGLWHFEESAADTVNYNSSTYDFSDMSGNNRHANQIGTITYARSGRIGSGIETGTDGVAKLSSSISLAGGVYTLAAWFKNPLATAATWNTLFRQFEVSGDHQVIVQVATGLLGSYRRSDATFLSSGFDMRTLSKGWHHLVVRAAGGTSYFYIDGKQVGTVAWSSTANIGNLGNTENGNSQPFGIIDEVAIWTRALDPVEIIQLYRRGANRVKYQVRSCVNATCSANPSWLGADGTNQTYFSELYNTASNSVLGAVQPAVPTMTFSNFGGLTVADNQYFQYRAILESDDENSLCNYGAGAVACSPELKSVSAGPTHYSKSSPSIYGLSGASFGEHGGFIETLGSNGCSSGIGYNLSLDKTNWYWFDSAKASDCVGVGSGAWCLADGTAAESNSASVVQTSLSEFVSNIGSGTVYFKAYLKSSGSSPCELDNLEINAWH